MLVIIVRMATHSALYVLAGISAFRVSPFQFHVQMVPLLLMDLRLVHLVKKALTVLMRG